MSRPRPARSHESPVRRSVLYVTIDPWDHHRGDGTAGNHTPNFERLRAVARTWRGDVCTDDLWAPELTDARLADPSLLALFLAGSFTEWVEAFRQPEWARLLDRLCAQIASIHVPILAVCGSHQLVARGYGGWGALAHISAPGARPVTIAQEADGLFRAPDPRPAEIGVFRFRRHPVQTPTPDPLLDGLPDPAYFVQYHRDLVVCASKGAVPLLVSDGPAEASPPQALRYDVDPPGRILYTLQFHPELVWAGSDPHSHDASAHGTHLIRNFLSLAEAYWKTSPALRATPPS